MPVSDRDSFFLEGSSTPSLPRAHWPVRPQLCTTYLLGALGKPTSLLRQPLNIAEFAVCHWPGRRTRRGSSTPFVQNSTEGRGGDMEGRSARTCMHGLVVRTCSQHRGGRVAALQGSAEAVLPRGCVSMTGRGRKGGGHGAESRRSEARHRIASGAGWPWPWPSFTYARPARGGRQICEINLRSWHFGCPASPCRPAESQTPRMWQLSIPGRGTRRYSRSSRQPVCTG
ncbi:hypothetical protein QBC39DRAFT_107736 [Podospora conica]|nr:hypothetical protein QBC39DRAFT_107736 [Schizothecium conicum]